MLKLLVLTEGGEKYGYGHVARCAALAQAISHFRRTSQVKFLIRGRARRIQFLKSENISFKFNDWLRNDRTTLKCVKEYDLVVVDSYEAGQDFYKKLENAKGNSTTVAFTDFKKSPVFGDFIINPLFKKGYLSRSRDVRKVISGEKFILLRKEFWAFPKKSNRNNIRNVLVAFGGTKRILEIQNTVKVLRELLPNGTIHIVSPGYQQQYDNRVLIHQSLTASAYRNLLTKTDLAISAGGQTLLELIRAGVPTVAAGLADNQIMNLKHWYAKGVLGGYLQCDDPNFTESLKFAILKLLPLSKRRRVSTKGQVLIDGVGALRIAKILIAHTKRLIFRKALGKDCDLLLNWRNHSEVRKQSFSTEKIVRQDHIRWFRNRVHNRKVKIYIAEDRTAGKIGVIRFESLGKFYGINIMVNPKFFGKGFGTKIISLGTEKFRQDMKYTKPIIAEIRPSNIRSVKAFENAGFHFLERVREGSGKGKVTKFIYNQTIL